MVASVKISWDGGDVAPVPRFPVSRGDRKKTQTTASVPKKSVSLQGCTPKNCALFCAHPDSKSVLLRSSTALRFASTGIWLYLSKNHRLLGSRSRHTVMQSSAGMPFANQWKGVIVPSGAFVAATNDSRRYPRHCSPKGTLLAWQAASVRDVSRVINLSLGGIYVRATEPPPVGTSIQLLLVAPTVEVRARGVVQRSEPQKGMGIKLIAMQQDDRARFASWLKRLSP